MIIKSLEMVSQEIDHPTDSTAYYPGVSVQLTTCTHGFPDITVVAMSGTGMSEPIAFTLEEVKALQGFLLEIMYDIERANDAKRVAW